VKRFREILGIKQESLAADLGEEWTQKKVSSLEAKEKIDEEVMEQIAKALNIPSDAIRNFDEEKTIFNIQHNYEGSNASAGVVNAGPNSGAYYECSFNPLEKLIQTMDQLTLVYAEKEVLYERLLKCEQEKVELLKASA
ncbi:MAG: helix-turn-helix domain-containing protein, partial [Pedobacter sp.]|nr:helix-turn-helix domain-containing protein [Pedobacter sp.]